MEQSGEHEFPSFDERDAVEELAVTDDDELGDADPDGADIDAVQNLSAEDDGADGSVDDLATDDGSAEDAAQDDSTRPLRSRVAAPRRRRAAVPARLRGQALADGARRRMHGIDPRRAVVMALVVSVVAMTLAMPLRTYFSQHSEFQQLSEANEQLRGQVDDFQQRVNEQNDPAYIEAQARERLQFVRPGETPLVMMYAGDTEREAAEQRERAMAEAPWYDTLWRSVTEPPRQ